MSATIMVTNLKLLDEDVDGVGVSGVPFGKRPNNAGVLCRIGTSFSLQKARSSAALASAFF
jgi:hypothetical protein